MKSLWAEVFLFPPSKRKNKDDEDWGNEEKGEKE
jgi:hypothetical protein